MIIQALKDVEIQAGDTVLVHSDLTAIRNSTGLSWLNTAEAVKEEIQNIIGLAGTLLVPTFNWDFCQGKPYIHEKTMSRLGLFSNNVLFDERSSRSIHPIFSFAGIGPATNRLFPNIGNSSFGKNSVFERLLDENAKILLINSISDIAFVHYVEQKSQVSYRFMKIFSGDVFVENINTSGTYDFFVRRKNDTTIFDGDALHQLLLDSGAMKKSEGPGGYPVCSITCRDCDEILTQKLKENPTFLRKVISG